MKHVTLSPSEVIVAAAVGAQRFAEALRMNLKDAHGFSAGSGIGIHIEGAAGEMAFAKAENLWWEAGINTFKGPDVSGVQVRTRSLHHYELIVRPSDRDDETFVLVTGVAPNFVVRGWILGREAKQERWLQGYGGRPPAYFVPQNELNAIT